MNKEYYQSTEPMERLLAALRCCDREQRAGPDLYTVRDRLEELNALYLAVHRYMIYERVGQPLDERYWADVVNQYEKIEKGMNNE